MNVQLEKRQIEAIAIHLREMCGDDEQAYHDMLDGETNLHELVARLLRRIEDDEGIQAALVAQIGDRNFRKERAGARIDGYREAIMALLDAARLDKLQLPEATISVRTLPQKALLSDESALPEEFWRVTRSPDLSAISAACKAGAEVPGTVLNNPSRSVTIRRK